MNATETKKLVFPSHNTQPCQNETIFDLAKELVASAIDTNNFLAAGDVHYLVRSHYVNTATGDYGIESLIKRILSTAGAIFPATVVNDDTFRHIALATSLTTDEIIAAIRGEFGNDRYPDSTIRMYLSPKGRAMGTFGKIQMTAKEDSFRECNRPRCKWFIIQSTIAI